MHTRLFQRNVVTNLALNPSAKSMTWFNVKIDLTLSVLNQFYKYHFFSLAQTWVHSYAITSRTKQAVYTNFQLWIAKTATFNLTTSGVTSDLTLTVSCVLNRSSWPLLRGSSLGVENKRSVNFHRFGLGHAGGSIDSCVGDLCNHVGFTDVAAQLAAVWTKNGPWTMCSPVWCEWRRQVVTTLQYIVMLCWMRAKDERKFFLCF
jgi:hypothetical protein